MTAGHDGGVFVDGVGLPDSLAIPLSVEEAVGIVNPDAWERFGFPGHVAPPEVVRAIARLTLHTQGSGLEEKFGSEMVDDTVLGLNVLVSPQVRSAWPKRRRPDDNPDLCHNFAGRQLEPFHAVVMHMAVRLEYSAVAASGTPTTREETGQDLARVVELGKWFGQRL